MYEITNNKIKLTRGDTMYAEVGMKDENGDPYTPQVGDSIRFVLKHATLEKDRSEYTDPNPLIEKAIPIDTCILHLEPEDTKPLGFGNYVYDCEITLANGDVDTFINNMPFTLVPEVG